MEASEQTITFPLRDFKGSRLRCLLITSLANSEVANFFQSVVGEHASVGREEAWAPRGFLAPDEAKLGETSGFLSQVEQDEVTRWWLARPGRANTPNWDLLSNCRMGEKHGLIMVEAKAHEGEFSDGGCGATDEGNTRQIRTAIEEASRGLNELKPGFALSAERHYQLSNRFAFAWKLAKMGVPVVLVYLGFLDSQDMASNGRILFKSHTQWRNCVKTKSKGIIPSDVWDTTLSVDGIPLTMLIRSAEVKIETRLV
jgi:hypothetical protein